MFAALDYVPMNFVGEPIGLSNWFGFYEAWAAPAEHAGWLSEALAGATSRSLEQEPSQDSCRLY